MLAHGQQVDRLGIALEQGAPVGTVGHLTAEQVFDQPRLLAGGNPHDRQRLAGTLVEPARWQLGRAGNADLDARGVGQVHHMIGHAELLAPRGFAAGALIVVAFFRGHDAHVALRKLGHARVAVTLAETGLGLAPAVAAMDGTEVFQAHGLADQGVDRHFLLAQAKSVLHHRRIETRRHFTDGAAAEFDQWIASDLNRRFGTGADFELHSCGPM
ncbi:hypothetical protein D3C81_1467240 [compost metagenome]